MTVAAHGVTVDLEVADIIRAAREAARAEPRDRVRYADRQIEHLDRRLALLDGAIRVAERRARMGRRPWAWWHPRGLRSASWLRGVREGLTIARADLVETRQWWRDHAEEAG